MIYRSLESCVLDLERHGHLVRCDEPLNGHLEVAEVQRRCYASGGPAVLYTQVDGGRFRLVSNLFGTLERARFIFRDTLESVRRAIELKIDAGRFFTQPGRYWRAPLTALHMRPRRTRNGPVLGEKCRLSDLPRVVSWPLDGGPFITLPQVYSEDSRHPGLAQSNLGMYRIQIAGNQYLVDRQVGLHYQIHRGIGIHHQAALESRKPFRVHIFVGGAPAMTLAAVMPLPEGMSELGFAGALAGHRIPMVPHAGSHVYAEADFCIVGTVSPHQELPEGPFGDHLGYYSLQHDFPVLNVEKVFHRRNAIWPFTVVGRPPQEDTVFGQLIHELTGPILPTVLPGVRQVHAVDAAGVHPLLLAVGSERYVPYRPADRPAEILTQANAILGQGQLSLAKYLWIIDGGCAAGVDVHDVGGFLQRMLERVDWRRDLHFQTKTTLDTLDYSSGCLNEGSKVVIAAAGPPRRQLPRDPRDVDAMPEGFHSPQVVLPGILVVNGPPTREACHNSPTSAVGSVNGSQSADSLQRFASAWRADAPINQFPLIVIVDDSQFAAKNFENFLWVCFTRSHPAIDITGIESFVEDKHWGCRGSLIIDARIQPHHAPPLETDPAVTKKIDALATRGLPISKWL